MCAAVVLAAALAACSSGRSHAGHGAGAPVQATSGSNPLVGALIAASTDLGPSRAHSVDVLMGLAAAKRPAQLDRWAAAHHLGVRWTRGDRYALVHGTAAAMSTGLGISIHDYKARSGKQFYATTRYAVVPRALRASVTGVGSILSYVLKPTPAGLGFHADVPAGGLTPSQLLRSYDATPLAEAGYTGKGKTVVFFELDGYTQADMDKYAQISGTSRFTPVLDTSMPGKVEGETEMDLEVVHAIAPDAKLVVYDIASTWRGTSAADYMANIAKTYQQVAQKYPGAIWSISIGTPCDRYFSATDLQPLQDAMQAAVSQGTAAFMSSGDTGGLECKAAIHAQDFGTPPTTLDVGVSAINTPPAVTSVGGTALNTDANGGWISEQAWSQFALQQGTSGGPSLRFPRPSWQTGPALSSMTDPHRLTPDVSADADPETGVKTIIAGREEQGGGTSQAAPIWAGLTVLMNQYLEAHGGKALSNLNELLYKAAASTPSAFHDVTLGANAPYVAGKGFDFLTGLGTPDTAVLVKALQAAQGGQS